MSASRHPLYCQSDDKGDGDPRAERAATGALLGLALGDALGFPAEFDDVPAILAEFGPWRAMDLPRPRARLRRHPDDARPRPRAAHRHGTRLPRPRAAGAAGARGRGPYRLPGDRPLPRHRSGLDRREALATGLLCFLLLVDEPLSAPRRAACTSGDSDSIACLTGAFAGAHHGADVWPAAWTDRIEYRDEPVTPGALRDA